MVSNMCTSQILREKINQGEAEIQEMIRRFLVDRQKMDEKLREKICSKSIRVMMGIFFLDTEAKITSLKFLKEVDIRFEEEEDPRLNLNKGTPNLPPGKKKRTRRGTRGKGRKINYKVYRSNKTEVEKDVARNNAVKPKAKAEAEVAAEAEVKVEAEEHKPEETETFHDMKSISLDINKTTWNGRLGNDFWNLLLEGTEDTIGPPLAGKPVDKAEESEPNEGIQDRQIVSAIEQLLYKPIKE